LAVICYFFIVTLSKHQILGQPVNLSPDYWGWLVDRINRGINTHVVTMNAEMVMQANQSPELAKILQQADLIAADGAGIVMALKLHGIKQQRCAGIDLGARLLQLAGERGANCPVALYGGKPEVLPKAVAFWQRQLPGLSIVAQADGYINQAAQQDLLNQLQQQQPKIILVALGIPRQEVWIAQHRQICPQAIWVGVGGSFDVWSGTKKRAPVIFQKLNLEWLYRLAQEPTRWRRMLALPQFMLLAMAERLQGKSQSNII
jgi:N-acetylglucosaminyldiphosphoundecaprenol N-acetyl-beta-D-mannosaminyltransferase